MDFKEYLNKTANIADEEKAVLDELSESISSNGKLNKLEYRAARSSLQVIIMNKHYQQVLNFLYQDVNYPDVVRKRIASYMP